MLKSQPVLRSEHKIRRRVSAYTFTGSQFNGTYSSSITRDGLSEYIEDRFSVNSRMMSAEEIKSIGVFKTRKKIMSPGKTTNG